MVFFWSFGDLAAAAVVGVVGNSSLAKKTTALSVTL